MRVLIVEDDFVNRRLLQRYLLAYGDCDMAVNGREALTALELARQEGTPDDLICLDIMMPEMDGLKTLKALRRLEEAQGVPQTARVIMTTVCDDFDSVFKAFDRQCDAYLVKPVDRRKLTEHLKNMGLLPENGAGE